MRRVGVGVVSLGWMGGLHARSYLGVAARYPELGVRLAAVGDGEVRQATVTDALVAAEVVEAAIASARNGRWERT